MTRLSEVCDHCERDLGEHLVPDSRCPTPGGTTHFFMAAYHPFDALVRASEAIPPGEVWTGPPDSDPMAAFGPGTTRGGRAEAGWFEVGKIVGDGPTFKPTT